MRRRWIGRGPNGRDLGLGLAWVVVVAATGCGRSEMFVVPSTGADTGTSTGGSETDADTSTGTTTVDPDTTIGPDSSTTDETFGSSTTFMPPIECGNGIVEPGEECDPGEEQIGPNEACVPGCIFNVCGDGMPGPMEACDDGNDDPFDACLPGCVPATCGDGLVWEGVEECDDADGDDHDACHVDCTSSRVVSVAVGGNHACAMTDRGRLRCWGNGNNGRTGYATEDNFGDDEPALAAGMVSLGSPIDRVVTGLSHTCVRYAGGQLRCFGRGGEGQLGYGNPFDIGDDEVPTAVGFVPAGGPVELLSTRGGAWHTCVRLAGGVVRCWGPNNAGQLGVPGLVGPVGDNEPAGFAPPVDVGAPVAGLSVGFEHVCARLVSDGVRCWGNNGSGQLGLGVPGNVGDDETPASVGDVPVGGPVLQVSAGFHHTCALMVGGTVRCWGRGNNGRLGYGSSAWIGLFDTPADHGTVDVGGPVVQIAAGNAHTCALLDGGTVRCWGWAGQGQLGYGNLEDIGDDELPASAGDVPVGVGVLQIAADGNATCALTTAGQVRCWGNGGDGRLGYGNTETIGDDETPASAGDVPLFPP